MGAQKGSRISDMIKESLFKIFLKIAHSLAPHKGAAKDSLGKYYEEEKRHKNWETCQAQQREMDACIRPRTDFSYRHKEDEQ
jgi:hypothetical protein